MGADRNRHLEQHTNHANRALVHVAQNNPRRAMRHLARCEFGGEEGRDWWINKINTKTGETFKSQAEADALDKAERSREAKEEPVDEKKRAERTAQIEAARKREEKEKPPVRVVVDKYGNTVATVDTVADSDTDWWCTIL
jgi:hypothetical protein